ncbi:MAG: ATP-binding protein [Thermaceae bacterium]
MNPWELWESAREGIVVHEERKTLYLNPKAAELLEVDREKVLGKPLLLALRDHRLEALALFGGERTLEVRGRWLSARAVPGALYLLDETELQNKMASLEEAAQILAHEFRTPVAGLRSLLEALSPKSEEEKTILSHLKREASRLARLIEDLSLKGPRPLRTFDLKEVWPRLQVLLGPQLSGRQVFYEAQGLVRADPDAVFQVLLNLLDNALKYGQDPIRVVSFSEKDRLHLEVLDSGPPLAAYEPLFLPGQRGFQGGLGRGLGLYLVRRLSHTWGGEAYALRREGGNAFGVFFPLDWKEEESHAGNPG